MKPVLGRKNGITDLYSPTLPTIFLENDVILAPDTSECSFEDRLYVALFVV